MIKICKPSFWILVLTVLVLVSPNAYAQVADIAVTPTSLAFGTVNVGATATLTTTISNVGGADLTVSELAFTGSPDFSLNPAAPLAPFVVAPGASVDVPVDYTPSITKAVSAAIWVVSDDPDEGVLAVSLSGNGVTCDINVNPLVLDFGVVSVGTTQTLSTTISNTGNAVCTVDTLTLAGSPDFSLNPATPAPPFTVTPGGSVTVTVDYTSSDFVDDVGTLAVASDDPDESLIMVDLSGVPPANACDVDVGPPALDFGLVAKGTTQTLSTTIRNLGSVDCTVDLSLTGSPDFALNPAAPATPFTVAPGTSVDVPVDYTPADLGADSGTLNITSNDPDPSPVTIGLSGAGLGVPDIAVSPTLLAFGPVRTGATATLTTTISNVGDADLTISEFVFTGSPDFSLNAAAPTPPFVIASGSSVDVPVDYRPSVEKAVNAALWIASDDPDENPLAVSLTGTGVGNPDIDVSPLALDFGVSVIGTTTTLTTTISNVGRGDLTVTGLLITGSTEFVLNPAAPATPFTVAVGASVDVPVDYIPADDIADTGTLEIDSDDPDEGLVAVTLSGTGVSPAAACDIDVTPMALDFGSVEVGASQTLSTTIRNRGSVDCSVDLSLTGSAEFTLGPTAPASPFILSFDESVAVPVVYTPVDGGADSGTLDITSNDPVKGVVSVVLSGSTPRDPHKGLPVPSGEEVCYACHVNRNVVEQRSVSTEICLQCHSNNPVPDPTLVPDPVAATAANIHGDSITGTTRFQYDIKCTNCHDPHENSNQNGWQQVQYVNDFVFVPSLQVTDFTQNPTETFTKTIANYVQFTDDLDFIFKDPTDTFTRGICNTCHTRTNHHRNETMDPFVLAPGDLDGSGTYIGHNDTTRCTDCHTHTGGFAPTGGTPAAPHDTQPFVDDCTLCHVGSDFAASIPDTKCEQCHTPGGSLKGGFPAAPDVLTHSDANGSGQFTYTNSCVDCHNPMTPQTNLSLVRSTLSGSVVPGSNIDFTAFSGPGSFADGPPHPENVCNTCHTQTNHHQSDGTAPGGQSHNDGVDCSSCHPHSDAFLPTGGDCIACHSQAQPAGGQYRRQVTGPGGDFERSSHHVSDGTSLEIVTAADCQVCHDQTNHQANADPSVFLNDPDGGTSYIYDGSGGSIENFCLNCHDADSSMAFDSNANSGDGNQPFSDGRTPLDIDSGWTMASHNAALTAEACLSCHGGSDSTRSGLSYDQNVHGALISSMLSGVIAGTTVANNEEALCYTCHDGGIASTDIENQFAKGTNGTSIFHHPVVDSEQSGGRTVECADCHNPHYATNAEPFLGAGGVDLAGNPVDVGVAVEEYEVCFKCHGDTYNAGRDINSDGIDDTTNKRLDFASNASSYHPVAQVGRNQSGALQEQLIGGLTTSSMIACSDCHNNEQTRDATGKASNSTAVPQGPHGSTIAPILRANSDLRDHGPDDPPHSNFELCLLCHDESKLVNAERFSSGARTNFYGASYRNLHREHFNHWETGATCRTCHFNTHGNQAASNTIYRIIDGGTTNYTSPPVGYKTRGVNFAPYVLGNSFSEPVWQLNPGTRWRSCDLSCHGKRHQLNDGDYTYKPQAEHGQPGQDDDPLTY